MHRRPTRRAARRPTGRTVAATGAVAVAVLLLTTGGSPVPTGVVASDSMEPALSEGDVFVAIPPALTGGAAVGDIAVYRGPDGWTVHRLVGRTDAGFLTAGDANPFVDQDTGDPPLLPSSIAGVVPTVGARPLAVSVPRVPRSSTVGITGVVAVAFLLAANHRAPPPRPVTVGTLVGLLLCAGWVLAASAVESSAIETVTNRGWLPVTVLETGATEVRARSLAPGESVVPRAGSTVVIGPGWAPQFALDVAARGGLVGVAVGTSLVVAGGVWLVARSIWSLGRPDPDGRTTSRDRRRSRNPPRDFK
ncbi:MAG: S24/S26 family peptidase [Halobacteriales archaeon]